MAEFHFLRPYFLFAIIPALLLIGSLYRRQQSHSSWQNVCDPHLLPYLLVTGHTKNRSIALWLLLFAWLLAITALAGPTWSKQQTTVFRSSTSRVIVLDLSPAMYAEDLKPSRLVRAKYKVRDILNNIKEGNVGMVVFSSNAYTVSPLTQDANTIAAMLPELRPDIMPVAGDNMSAGLTQAVKLLQQAGARHGQIVLLTASPVTADDLNTAKRIQDNGFTLSILGVGTQKGAPIPSTHGFARNTKGQITLSQLQASALKELAHIGGGIYQSFNDTNSDIETLLRQAQPRLLQAKRSQQTIAHWKDQGQYIVFLLLILALCAKWQWWQQINN